MVHRELFLPEGVRILWRVGLSRHTGSKSKEACPRGPLGYLGLKLELMITQRGDFSVRLNIFTFATGAGPVTGLIIPEHLAVPRCVGRLWGSVFLFIGKEAAPLLFPVLCILIVSAFISYDFCFMMLLVNSPWTFDVSSFSNACKYSMVETERRSLQEIEMSLNPNFSVRDK
ncbi:hypothetical protein POTOM_008259 [Populus tomentosa]|uniref:Uncharacterized protein n=1 Tax=Populus tomentosa TaxID=118781 RepID=A0A8X8DCD9_POPTO|nr:hypothetical protein POTOM_008259 [Populus tomentosa]